MTHCRIATIGLCLLTAMSVLADGPALRSCGDYTAPPRATASEATPRKCPTPEKRDYNRRYSGLAYELLDAESEACFVPDAYFELMDALIDDVKTNVVSTKTIDAQYAQSVSRAIGDVLTKRGFAFYTPIDTLSDAFERRTNADGGPLYVFDCDTSSIIYLTIAENLRLPLSMVEVAWRYGSSDHNYVRWRLDDGTYLDWDTNGRYVCKTPADQPPQLGRAMTRDEAFGSGLMLRANAWERKGDYEKAVKDNRRAIELYPDGALPANNFAWLVATKKFDGREDLANEALAQAQRAVKLVDKPNHLDTLACAYAFKGDFRRAVATMKKAVRREPTQEFLDRLTLLKKGTTDCTGLK